MKKIMTLAFAAVFAASAFAQNPDALKQIKKAKTFDEAQTLITANESSMSAAENAQAYNKLVDIAYKSVANAQATIEANNLAEQMGQTPKEQVDMAAFYNDIYVAIVNALKCDKFDVEPNEKGKVAPKFRKANADRLLNYRLSLVNGGQEAQEAENLELAVRYYGTYVTSGKADLFKDAIAAVAKNTPDGVGDPYIYEVARVASICAFNNKDTRLALAYTDVLMENPEQAKEALNMKMYFIEQGVQTHEDSVRCLGQLKQLYQKYPEDSEVFSQLATWYSNLGYTDQQKQLIDERIQSDPANFTAWAMKGQTEMNAQDYDNAIESLKKSVECQAPEEIQKALVNTFIGYCYNSKAAAEENPTKQLEYLKAAIPFLEKAREMDPNRDRANWKHPLYQSYYYVYGEDDARTKEVEALQ